MRDTTRSPRCGFTLVDLAAALLGLVLLSVTAIPLLGSARTTSGVQQSMSNLTVIGLAHAMYGADYNGRQLTYVVDDIASYGNSGAEAFPAYLAQHGVGHPNMLGGWGEYDGGVRMYRYVLDGSFSGHHNWVGNPIIFPGTGGFSGFGWFRLSNLKSLHDYVGGKWYDPTYYAPNDVVPWDWAEPHFDNPWEMVRSGDTGGTHVWTSYSLSPAALFDPDVMRHPDDGGWQNPWTIDYGLQTPTFAQALYPSLKTQFMEHHWNQSGPLDPCNQNFYDGTYDGCEPLYFNHGMASEPVTLFYDNSVRLLPNIEVKAADNLMIAQTGSGLWSRDTSFGVEGYYNDYSYDPVGLSHHILTTDGIRGRDTLAAMPLRSLPAPANRQSLQAGAPVGSLQLRVRRFFDPTDESLLLRPE